MTLGTGPWRLITTGKPASDAGLDDWTSWFWGSFLPAWIEAARPNEGIGFYDA